MGNVSANLIKSDASCKEWFLNGELHRENGPALEYINGDKYWYTHGKVHREAGPAVEFANGDNFWYINNKLHREDGPAIEYSDRGKEWYFNGIFYGINNKFTNKSWKRFVKTLIFY